MSCPCRQCSAEVFHHMLQRLMDWAVSWHIQIAFSRIYVTRQAVDVDVFVDGVRQEDLAAYQTLGAYWEAMGGAWGEETNVHHFKLEKK